MTPTEKINLRYNIMFEALDEKSKYFGFKNWKDMKKILEPHQISFIESVVRLALKKYPN